MATALNRVITTTDPLTRTTVYSYDLVGNQTVMTNAAGLPTRYGYDADHELTGITYALTSTPNVTYTYTASGQRQTMTDGTGTSSYQYSLLDQVITSTTGAGASVGYRYDPAGNLSGLVYPDSSAITRTYDAANRLTGITDWLGHTTGFAYDAADRLITQTYPNTTTASFSYNAADQLTGIVDRANGTPFWTYSYSRDSLGNISASSDPINGSDSDRYDAQARLSQDQRVVSGITATTTWADDAAGELRTTGYTSTNGAAVTSTLGYDAGSALSSLQVLSCTALTHAYIYTSTATGARSAVSDTLSAARASYSYDQADRLIGFNAGTGQYSYGYDGDGLRQSKALSGTTEAYTWDTAEGLPQLLQDSGTRYIMGPDGLPLEQVSVTGTVLYYYQDQLGSTRALLTGATQTAGAYAYNAFGGVAYKTGSATNPFGYAGQYTDPETGFEYLQARYYDPATSQFLTRDPLVAVTGQPYAYADDDPVNESDPAGFFGNCPGLDFASPVGNHACTGPLSAATLWVALHFPSQAHQVAVQARTANQQATQWVQTTPSGRLFNNMVIQPVCTLQDPHATRQEKANAAFDLAMLGSGPFGGELGALGDAGDVGAAGSDAGRILDAGGDAGAGQTAIGFSQDTVTTAYQGMRSGGGHAMRHLIDEGLIPNSGSLASRASTFERLTSPILTNPVRTFDWKLGSTLSRAFAGVINGKRVVVFVAKEGPYEGRVLSAVVPDANQVAQWGLP